MTAPALRRAQSAAWIALAIAAAADSAAQSPLLHLNRAPSRTRRATAEVHRVSIDRAAPRRPTRQPEQDAPRPAGLEIDPLCLQPGAEIRQLAFRCAYGDYFAKIRGALVASGDAAGSVTHGDSYATHAPDAQLLADIPPPTPFRQDVIQVAQPQLADLILATEPPPQQDYPSWLGGSVGTDAAVDDPQ